MSLEPDRPPDLLIVNADIYTVDPTRPRAQALAVLGEVIAAIGSDREMRRLAGPSTRVVDARGHLAVPGFNDAHVHFIMGAEELVGLDLRPSRDEADLAQRLGRFAATLPAGEWITGGYWDHEAWPGATLPTRASLDAVTPNHPVFVKRLDGHMAVANTLAMRLAGIDADVSAPAGGVVERDEGGRLTGLFKDAAMDLVTRAIPAAALDAVLRRARAALKHAAALGVTTVQDMTGSAVEYEAYERLHAAGELTVRISSIQNYDASTIAASGIATGRGDDWLKVGGRKFFADGSMGASTAAFFEPYADDPQSTGLLMYGPGELERLIREADAAGFQPVVHAIGDRANTLVLDIFERLGASRAPGRSWRPRIEHAQVVRPEDKVRFAATGVVASIQPSHCIDDMRWAEARIGQDRCAMAYNVRSFVEGGVHVAFGTDWFVAPLDPMIGLYAAVTRQFADGTPAGGWFPGERITMAQAVDCYTAGSAYAERAEHRKGRLSPGYLADLVILSRDIFAVPPREILDTRSLLTIVGGTVVFDALTASTPTSSDTHAGAGSRAEPR